MGGLLMATDQKFQGFVGQSMSGGRRSLTPACATFTLGATVHTVKASGIYRFILWGGGGNGVTNTSSGGSGQLYIAERALVRGDAVIVVVGAAGSNSTVTLPSGEVVTALGASATAPGSSTAKQQPADIVVNGTAGIVGLSQAGADGPSYEDYRGGTGGPAGSGNGSKSPAGGGDTSDTAGAIGMVLMHQIRMRS
jgi:hypothetical protein